MSLVAAAMLLTSLAVPQRSEAQARELGSPVPPGTAVTQTEAPDVVPEAPSQSEPDRAPTYVVPSEAPTVVPGTYEDLAVPPPPGTEPGIRYPGAEPQQRVMATDSSLRIPSGIATRLRALDSDFQVLSLRGSSVVGGIISILAGGLSVALGIVNDVSSGTFGAGMSPYLYVYGGSGMVRGVLELALMTNASGPAITFAHMPMLTMEEVQARLDYGEHELANLAERSMISRILDGSLSIAVGLAIVPINFGVNGWDDFESNPLSWIAIATAAISVVTGVITLVSTSEAERRWGAYQELRDRLAARGASAELDQGDVSEDELRADEISERRRSGVNASLSFGGVSGSF